MLFVLPTRTKLNHSYNNGLTIRRIERSKQYTIYSEATPEAFKSTFYYFSMKIKLFVLEYAAYFDSITLFFSFAHGL